MKLVTGYELLESTSYLATHSIVERFSLFNVNLYDVEDLKFLLFCLETGTVFHW